MTGCLAIQTSWVPVPLRCRYPNAALYYWGMANRSTTADDLGDRHRGGAGSQTDGSGAGSLTADGATDAEDVRLAQRGDGEAFERLVRRHQETVAAQMWRFTREPRLHAELVQDVFVNAWRSLRGFRGSAPFIHWLRKIAVRTGYAFWKERDARRHQVTLDDGIAATLAAPQAADAKHAAESVHAVLGNMPPRDRLVLTLLHLDGRTVAESAQLLGWSEVMVKVQAWRARGKLKKLLEQLETP